jgi:hypothetical protein
MTTIRAKLGHFGVLPEQEYGVIPHVVPEHPKMGHLVKALVLYIER